MVKPSHCAFNVNIKVVPWCPAPKQPVLAHLGLLSMACRGQRWTLVLRKFERCYLNQAHCGTTDPSPVCFFLPLCAGAYKPLRPACCAVAGGVPHDVSGGSSSKSARQQVYGHVHPAPALPQDQDLQGAGLCEGELCSPSVFHGVVKLWACAGKE
eukprot:375270-Pelagomonas_calceolata.AAC.4